MKKVILNNGLIAGIIVSLWMATSMLAVGCDNMMALGPRGMIIGYTGMLVAFSFIFVAVKNYRDKINGGVVAFGRAFGIGLLISLIASTFYVVTWLVVYYNFMPDFMDKYAAAAIEQAKSTGASAAELKAQATEMEWAKQMYSQPVNVVWMTYLEVFPIGLLVSLITAAILKRNRATIQEA
ncbi:DUF4199 domain-containing protein [Flavobacterium caeni]|uniref:DUF4199 domain-containing protein n=1 Tax=Flavobacterium caeni TaxID=490189 RepID=A0A1G5FQM3_9FLAO|nr:DUF4199 domain-containing protein [Flavobacterium caeni]SCY41539.1 Protein of unknown function [Flavobacterium caeni]